MNLLLRLSPKVSANVLPTYLSYIYLKHECIAQWTVDGFTVECWEMEGFSISSCSSHNTNHLAEMGSLVRVTFDVCCSSEKLHWGSLVTKPSGGEKTGEMSKPTSFPIKPAWQGMAYHLCKFLIFICCQFNSLGRKCEGKAYSMDCMWNSLSFSINH